MGRQRRHPVVRLFERDLLLVAHQPTQEIGRERAASEEFGVGAAIGYAGEGVLRVVEDFGHEFGVEALVGTEEFRLQMGRDRQVEHDVDRMFVLLHTDLHQRFTDVLLELLVVLDPLHDQVARITADASLKRPCSRASASSVSLMTAARISGSCILASFSSWCR